MRRIIVLTFLLMVLSVQGCGPKIKSEADQQTKKDSVDLQEGKNEGPAPQPGPGPGN